MTRLTFSLLEADYALKYVNSDYTVDVTSLGLQLMIWLISISIQRDIVTDSNGVQKGVSGRLAQAYIFTDVQ